MPGSLEVPVLDLWGGDLGDHAITAIPRACSAAFVREPQTIFEPSNSVIVSEALYAACTLRRVVE